MIEKAVILSLIITGIHTAFQAGNVLSPVRVLLANVLDRIIGKTWSRYAQKPLWDCLPCMASVWGIVLSWSFNVPLLLAICGLNVIISRSIEQEESMMITGAEQETEYHDEVPTLSRQKLSNG